MKKRFMSMMLSVVIAVSLLPVPVFAEEQEKTKEVTTANEIADVSEESDDDPTEFNDEGVDLDDESDDLEISMEDADENAQSANGASGYSEDGADDFIGEPAMLNGENKINVLSTEKITDLEQSDINILDEARTMVSVSFTQVSDATGYNAYYSQDKSTYKLVESSPIYYDTDKVLIEIYNLSAGTTYYVKIAPVFKTSDGDSEEGSFSSVLQVVTAPAKVSDLKQTNATKSSITLSWQAPYGASGYYVKNEKGKTLKTVTTNKAKVSADTGSNEDYYIYAYKKSSSGYIAESPVYKRVKAYASPNKPKNVAKIDWDYLTWMPTKSNKVKVKWTQGDDYYTVNGFQVEIYSVSGKTKLKTYNITQKGKTSVSFNLKKVKNKGFQIRIRAYVKINGNKCYGSWTSKKVIIPQAKIKLKKVSNKSIKVSWSKISNATSYTIYVCTNASASTEKWKKVAKVGKNQTSYTINNLKGWANKGVYVIPTVKINGKKYKASHTWALYTYYK